MIKMYCRLSSLNVIINITNFHFLSPKIHILEYINKNRMIHNLTNEFVSLSKENNCYSVHTTYTQYHNATGTITNKPMYVSLYLLSTIYYSWKAATIL